MCGRADRTRLPPAGLRPAFGDRPRDTRPGGGAVRARPRGARGRRGRPVRAAARRGPARRHRRAAARVRGGGARHARAAARDVGIDVASVPLWGRRGLFVSTTRASRPSCSCMTSACTIAGDRPDWGATLPAPRGDACSSAACLRSARHLHGLTQAALDKTLAEYGEAAPLTAAVVRAGLCDRGGGPRPPRDRRADRAALRRPARAPQGRRRAAGGDSPSWSPAASTRA